MAKASVPLTSLSEEQRAQAYARFEILRPALEDGVSQAQIARLHQLSKSTVQRWVARYREQGLAGLAQTARKEDFLVTHRFSHFIEFLIVDEANRLKDAGLEQSCRS